MHGWLSRFDRAMRSHVHILALLPLLGACHDAAGIPAQPAHSTQPGLQSSPASHDTQGGAVDAGRGAPRPWIDTHAHPRGLGSQCTTASCVDVAVATMDRFGLRKSIWMSPPSVDTAADEAAVRDAVSHRPDRLFLGAGGTELNAIIHRKLDGGASMEARRREVASKVASLVADGHVVVFGEIAALHLSYEAEHPYEEIPPDSPLVLMLADEAAARGIPIDLHMDVVRERMTTPPFFAAKSRNNPRALTANVPGFERLLAHGRRAKIVWAHVGRDTTGHMTPTLVRRLLETHENLYCQIAPQFGPLGSDSAIVDRSGTIRPEWLALLGALPERFVLGTDLFYDGTRHDERLLAMMGHFLEQLPADAARKIGCENPVVIYALPSGC